MGMVKSLSISQVLPYNLSQTIKIIIIITTTTTTIILKKKSIAPSTKQVNIWQGGKTTTHEAKWVLLPGSWELPGSPGCLGVGLGWQQGRGQGGHGDKTQNKKGEGVPGGSCGGWLEANYEWRKSPFSDTAYLLKKKKKPISVLPFFKNIIYSPKTMT